VFKKFNVKWQNGNETHVVVRLVVVLRVVVVVAAVDGFDLLVVVIGWDHHVTVVDFVVSSYPSSTSTLGFVAIGIPAAPLSCVVVITGATGVTGLGGLVQSCPFGGVVFSLPKARLIAFNNG
jgi:hypothetical protein